MSYTITVPNGTRLSVATLDDLFNGSFYELAHFGKIPTEHQRRLWLEQEGGTEADKQRLAEVTRMKAERDIPEPQFTSYELGNS